MSEKSLDKLREQWRNSPKVRQEIIDQHSISSIKKFLDGVFDYTDIKLGEIKKNQGDVVIINLKNNPELPELDFKEYFTHTHWTDRIETLGIYTNIYWNKEFYKLLLERIIQ